MHNATLAKRVKLAKNVKKVKLANNVQCNTCEKGKTCKKCTMLQPTHAKNVDGTLFTAEFF